MGITKTREIGIVALRVLMGSVFLYAGVEKVLGVGLEAGKHWTSAGFLKFGTVGSWPGAAQDAVVNPFHSFWAGFAADPQVLGFIDFIVPWGEVAIGAALIVGLATRFASLMGATMLGLFYVAGWGFSLGVINSQFVYLIVTALLGVMAAGEVYGLDRYVERTRLVLRAPRLRYVLG